MRNTAKQIASIAFALTVLSTVSRAEQVYFQFYIDYAVVQYSLKSGVGNWDKFMKLSELNRNSATAIAKFWTFKSQNECYEYIKENVRRRITTGLSKEEHEKITNELREQASQCYINFYYDNWDELNQMVVQNYKAVLAEKDK